MLASVQDHQTFGDTEANPTNQAGRQARDLSDGGSTCHTRSQKERRIALGLQPPPSPAPAPVAQEDLYLHYNEKNLDIDSCNTTCCSVISAVIRT